jgi:hypothetical protein
MTDLQRITAYWTPPHGGPIERFLMPEIDFQSARRRFPNEWFLEAPKGAPVIDKTENRRAFDSLGKN